MKKRLLFVVLGVLLVVGIIAGIKFWQIRTMIDAGKQFAPQPATVTAAPVQADKWESLLVAVGSLSAVQGVTVAADQPGKVVDIAFASGDRVARGDLLVQQDVSTEEAQLPGTEAQVALTRANRQRAGELLAQKFISQAEFDAAEAAYRQARATAANLRAVMAKKGVRAPFAGRLGIRLVNLGQMLSEGDPVVSLQTLDPIFVDFQLPQQDLADLASGLTVRVTTDALPGRTFSGRITAINPEVDPVTRNVRVQATLDNSGEVLRPGMYTNVAVVLPQPVPVLAVPATAILYAPYSDSVFVIEESKGGKGGQVLRQQFVRLGSRRGDFVAVTSGLEAGQLVATTGVFKLRNGQAAVIDNTLQPDFKLAPQPKDD